MKSIRLRSGRDSGQALVLVLLSLAVVLTLVLFILSRSITDISVSSKNQDAVRAFSAAEAGVEKALVIGSGVGGTTTIGTAAYTSSVTAAAEGDKFFVYPIELASGDSAVTWFVAHDPLTSTILCDATHHCFTGNKLQVCWGKAGTATAIGPTPAVELSVFYEATPGNVATTQIARAAFDPFIGRLSAESPAKPNAFSSPDDVAGNCVIGGNRYQFAKTIQLSDIGIPAGVYNTQNGLQFVRIRMLYNTDVSQTLATNVDFCGALTSCQLPSQGQNIVATGTAGQSNRKINVFQGWPEAPAIFDGAIYSSTGLTN